MEACDAQMQISRLPAKPTGEHGIEQYVGLLQRLQMAGRIFCVESQRWRIDVSQALPEEGFVLLLGLAPQRLGHIRTVGRGRWQAGVTDCGQVLHFLANRRQCAVIQHDVMEQQ